MQITNRKWREHTVLDLNGRLMLGMDLVDFRNAVHDAIENNPTKLILNLANVTCIDFSSIGELVNALSYIKNKGGHLVLANPPRRVKMLLDAAQLTKVFEISNGGYTAI